MFHIALYEPEIPPNTGNIIRLCANAGAQLHLIHPFGFQLNEKSLLRAGLDYHEWAHIKEYLNFEKFREENSGKRIFACTTKGSTLYSMVSFQANDLFLFGPETRGLPAEILQQFSAKNKIKIPMKPESRSLNLSNAAAIILYEAWRQVDFAF